jgi:uncharacterized protein
VNQIRKVSPTPSIILTHTMLKNKTVLITGASSGIGAALAREASREGASLMLAARRKERLDALAGELRLSAGPEQRILTHPCNVADRGQAEDLVKETLSRLGTLDVLINNAGRGHLASVEDTTDETIQRMFALNVFSLWYTTRPLLPHMKKRGSGHILNIASIAGKLGFPLNSAYVAAKHAVVGFTHALRLELAGSGVYATVVCPAGVETEWASMTEGAPMTSLFAEAGPLAELIANELGVALPAIEGLIPADEAARRILRCIGSPVPELYTHHGLYEFLADAALDRSSAEERQLPAALAERAVYARMHKGT